MIVYDQNNNQVGGSGDLTPTQDHPGGAFTRSLDLTIGATYTAEIQVWNTNTVYTDYILQGTKDFTVQSGTNDIRIAMKPQHPTTLISTANYQNLKSSYYDSVTGAITTIGGEEWYTFTAPSEVAQIVVDPSNDSDSVYVGLFSASGEPLASSLSPAMTGGSGDIVTMVKGLTTGATYYLGLIEVSALGLEDRTGAVTVSDVAQAFYDMDEYDASNDTIAEANECYYQNQNYGNAYDADWYYFQAPTTENANIWFSFTSDTWGELQVCDSSGTTVYATDKEDGTTGKKLFLVNLSLNSGSYYYVKGDFYIKDSSFGTRTYAGMYTFAAGMPVPSLFVSPNIASVEKGQFLVNASNPSQMAYVWLSTYDTNVHSISSIDGGENWGTQINGGPMYATPIDFAADIDANGNIVVVYIEANTASGGVQNATAYWAMRPCSSSSWTNFGTGIWGTHAAGGPYMMLFPSVYRAGNMLKFGYGYDLGGTGNPNDTYAHVVTWNGSSMSGISSFLGYATNGGYSIVDNPFSQQVAGDTSGNTFYLYMDNHTDGVSNDLYMDYGGTEYIIANVASGYNAQQPLLIQRSTDFLLLYAVDSGTSIDLYGKAATNVGDIGTATPFMFASGITGANNYDAPYRSIYAVSDSLGASYIAYEQSGYIYMNATDGSANMYAGFGTLDGLSVNTEFGMPILYVSYHDANGNASVARLDPSAQM